jgi:hypothetical protein
MKKLAFTLALLALPAMAFAAGIDITWDDCIGGTPSSAKTFNCTANANYSLHFQFKLPIGLPNFVSLTGFADYQNQSNTNLSSFWHFEQGSCNQSPSAKGVTILDDQGSASIFAPGCTTPTDGGTVQNAFGDDGSGGTESVSAYGVDFRRPGNGYFVLLDYRTDGAPFPLAAGPNYWAWRLNFKTNNRAACAGCADAGIILWQRATFESNDGSPALNLDFSDKLSNCVTINGDSPTHCGIVPTRSTTWGQLKSLYR